MRARPRRHEVDSRASPRRAEREEHARGLCVRKDKNTSTPHPKRSEGVGVLQYKQGVNVQVSGGSAPPGYTGARPPPKGESGLCRQSTASDRQHHLRTLLGIASPWGEANRRRAQSPARLPTARARHPLLGWDGAPLPGFASGRPPCSSVGGSTTRKRGSQTRVGATGGTEWLAGECGSNAKSIERTPSARG